MNADYGDAGDYGRRRGTPNDMMRDEQDGRRRDRDYERDEANRPWSQPTNRPPDSNSYSSTSGGYNPSGGGYAPEFGAGDLWGGVESRRGGREGGYGSSGSGSRPDSRSGRVSEGGWNSGGSPNSWDNGRYQTTQGGNYGMGAGMTSGMNSGATNRGEHFGKGPKGYQRSDERVKETVSECLEAHPDLDASEVEVQVKGGIVTLTGTVEDRKAKRMAEDAVEGLAGVKDVTNQLQVSKPSNTNSGSKSGSDGMQTGQGQSANNQGSDRQKTTAGRG